MTSARKCSILVIDPGVLRRALLKSLRASEDVAHIKDRSRRLRRASLKRSKEECADNQHMIYRLRLAVAALVVLLAPASVPAQEDMTTLPCVPDCRGVDLSNTTLTGLNLNRVDLVNADLSDATLTNVSLVGADLTGASLFCANLIDTDLTAATLVRADMRKVDLSGKEVGLPPVLIRAVLIGADLSDANLNGADLRGADLSYTTMTSTYLGSAILNGATMVDIQGCDDSGRLPGCYVN